MENFKEALYNKVKSEVLKWNEEGIYAISFFVYPNEAYEYKGYSNVSMWAISYNTETDCKGAGEFDEERWNYAFWRQNETMIIDVDKANEYTDALFEWYAQQGVTDIGEEKGEIYDERCRYIGNGPAGHRELLQIASDIAKRLREEGIIKEHFGKDLPVIVHGLEYPWYDIEATKNANPNGQADVFLKALKIMGCC